MTFSLEALFLRLFVYLLKRVKTGPITGVQLSAPCGLGFVFSHGRAVYLISAMINHTCRFICQYWPLSHSTSPECLLMSVAIAVIISAQVTLNRPKNLTVAAERLAKIRKDGHYWPQSRVHETAVELFAFAWAESIIFASRLTGERRSLIVSLQPEGPLEAFITSLSSDISPNLSGDGAESTTFFIRVT